MVQIGIKCERMLKNRHFRLCTGSVLTLCLIVYTFMRCPSSLYVDKSLEDTLYISVSYKVGRTGNHLFKYASLLGIANKTGRRPVVPLGYPLTEFFYLSHVRHIDNGCWPYKREGIIVGHDPLVYDLPLTNVTVDAYLQSFKYFDHIQQIIRSEYTFKKHIQTEAGQYFKLYTKSVQKHHVVGIHVRRGDRLKVKYMNLGYTVPGVSYFKRAMDYMRSKVGNVTFIVVGDDLPWAKDNLNYPDTVIADDLPLGVHLAILSLCGHMIQSTGSFSWWAGWFVPGHVVYYKNYPTPGSSLAATTNKKDHYPSHWVAM